MNFLPDKGESMDNKKTDDVEAHGFNDDELADIMSEIEDLENDLSASPVEDKPAAKVEAAPAESSESKDVLLKLADMPQEKAFKTTPAKSYEASPVSGTASKMEFSVTGNMVVNLTFHVGGESVCLTVDEAQGLVIEMDGGAKFTLPLSGKASGKKVA